MQDLIAILYAHVHIVWSRLSNVANMIEHVKQKLFDFRSTSKIEKIV